MNSLNTGLFLLDAMQSYPIVKWISWIDLNNCKCAIQDIGSISIASRHGNS